MLDRARGRQWALRLVSRRVAGRLIRGRWDVPTRTSCTHPVPGLVGAHLAAADGARRWPDPDQRPDGPSVAIATTRAPAARARRSGETAKTASGRPAAAQTTS